jgi:hypothetical protein
MGMGMIDGSFAVTIKKEEVIGILIENLEKHKKNYIDAVEGFYALAKHKLAEAMLNVTNRNCQNGVSVSLQHPVYFADSYETAIEMLQMSVDKNITLNRDLFVKFVKDEWEWKHSFATSTM